MRQSKKGSLGANNHCNIYGTVPVALKLNRSLTSDCVCFRSVAPTFQVKPDDVTAKAGEKITVKAKATGKSQ